MLGFQVTLRSMPELLIFNLRSVHEPEIIQTREEPKKPKHNGSHRNACKSLQWLSIAAYPNLISFQ